jgi:hypothetical protein
MLVALLPLTAAPALADVGEGLVISGVFDGPLPGGYPKFIEVTALTDLDLLGYGLGSVNNGGGTDGEEFTFAAGTLAAGESFCVSNEIEGFEAYFGVSPEATSSAASINGMTPLSSS